MMIDKNNKILLEEIEREEQEKARLTKEAEERLQVEEQIRKEEEKLGLLKKEKEYEEQNRKKEQDESRINNFIESNNKTVFAETQREENKVFETQLAFIENKIEQTLTIA